MYNTSLDDLDVEEILESPEEPILTLNFKCNSDDYRSSEEMWSERFTIASTVKMRIHADFIILICVLVTLYAYGLNYSKYYYFVGMTVFFSIIVVSFNFYVIHACRQQYSYLMHIRTRRRIRSFSSVYENRTIREIKRIILPCEFKFYNTYFTKKIPTPDVMFKTTAEKIVDLPLTTFWPPIDYCAIEIIYENKKTITFFQRVFIPKDQLSEEETRQLDLIINKICIQNNITR